MSQDPPSTKGAVKYGDQPPPVPRWVKVFGLVAGILVLLFVGSHLTGHSPMGPGSHGPAAEVAGQHAQQP